MINLNPPLMNLILTFKGSQRNFKMNRLIRRIKLRLLIQEVVIVLGVIEAYFCRSVIGSMINNF